MAFLLWSNCFPCAEVMRLNVTHCKDILILWHTENNMLVDFYCLAVQAEQENFLNSLIQQHGWHGWRNLHCWLLYCDSRSTHSCLYTQSSLDAVAVWPSIFLMASSFFFFNYVCQTRWCWQGLLQLEFQPDPALVKWTHLTVCNTILSEMEIQLYGNLTYAITYYTKQSSNKDIMYFVMSWYIFFLMFYMTIRCI